jgi:hypothetical protein
MWVQRLSHTGSASWLLNYHHENMKSAESRVGSLDAGCMRGTLAGPMELTQRSPRAPNYGSGQS